MDDREQKTSKQPAGITRRDFMNAAAITGAGFMIVPRHVLGQGMTPPSDLVNVATVGINGMGASNTQAVMSHNIVAICDCDLTLLDAKLKQWQDQAYPPPPAANAGRQGGAGDPFVGVEAQDVLTAQGDVGHQFLPGGVEQEDAGAVGFEETGSLANHQVEEHPEVGDGVHALAKGKNSCQPFVEAAGNAGVVSSGHAGISVYHTNNGTAIADVVVFNRTKRVRRCFDRVTAVDLTKWPAQET